MIGSEWLGEVPPGWRVVPLWSLFTREKILGHVDEPMVSVFRDHGVVFKNSRENLNQTAEDRSIYQLVDPGWLVVNRMKAWQGSVGVSGIRGIVSGHYICFRPIHGEDHRYLNHLLRSPIYTAMLAALSRGVRPGQIEIDNDDLASLPVLLPPRRTQESIADFLDDQTSRVDSVIAARREQDRLLRQALQAEIDTTFDTTDCPAVRLSRWLRVLPGWSFPSDGFSRNEGDIRLLRGVNVAVGSLRWEDVVYWPANLAGRLESFALAEGDLVIGMDRPWIGAGTRVARVSADDLPCLLVQRVAKLIPGRFVTTDYLSWAYQASAFRAAVESDLTGLSVPHLSGEQIASHVVPALDVERQEAAARSLNDFARQTGGAQSSLAASIARLQEFKRSLIAAAVSGEFDVSAASGRGVWA